MRKAKTFEHCQWFFICCISSRAIRRRCLRVIVTHFELSHRLTRGISFALTTVHGRGRSMSVAKNLTVPCLLGSLLIVGGCATAQPTNSQPASIVAEREVIHREMPLVANYENKRNDMKKAIAFLVVNGLFDDDTGREVKESMDIEYVYYGASLVSLAHGNMDDYRQFVQLAEKELERAKTALTARVQALQAGHTS